MRPVPSHRGILLCRNRLSVSALRTLPRPGPGRSVRGSHNYFPGNASGSGLSFVACSGHRASGNLVGCAYRVVPGRRCGILVFLENGEEKRSLEGRQCAGDGVFCSRKKYLLIKNESFKKLTKCQDKRMSK